jgi:hypothetical protein
MNEFIYLNSQCTKAPDVSSAYYAVDIVIIYIKVSLLVLNEEKSWRSSWCWLFVIGVLGINHEQTTLSAEGEGSPQSK